MPPIVWEPEKVLVEGRPGSEHEIPVHFKSDKSLSNIVVDVVPELEDFVTAIPEEFDEVEADTTLAVYLTVSIPTDADPGSYDGTLRLRQGRRTIPRPLPIEVTAIAQESVTLTMVKPEGEGTVKPVVGTHTCAPGSEVELTATPEEDWRFDRWFIDEADGPETPETTVTMDTDRNVQAVFDEADKVPDLEAPLVDSSVVTTIHQSTQFLYRGDNPVQVGVEPEDIEPQRAAVVRGQVVDREGDALTGVTVSVLDHPEYGHTLTRDDGQFDLAVNGGGKLTVDFQHDGYLSAQRHVEVPWQDFEILSDVILVQLDEEATTMDLSDDEAQVHQADPIVDDDGERTATVFIPSEVSEATITLPNGTTQTLEEITVRATEYTEGDGGPESMPAELPPQVAYTYAVELSIDEALEADATHVEFNEPVVSYVDDFIGFGAGENVPTAYYDRKRGEWIPVEDGVVVEVVGVTDDERADLDITGDGEADDPDVLDEYGITDDERAELADLYDIGDVFWRVLVEHFSAWDYNWPFVPPEDAEYPNLFEWLFGGFFGPDVDCQQAGSRIDCLSQSMRTEIDLAGTDQALHYSSRRAPARKGMIEFPVTGDSLPESLERVEAEIRVAGQRHTRTYDDPRPALIDEFSWDGLDAYGRPLQGEQPVTVRIGYVYQGVYGSSSEAAATFGFFPTDVTGDQTREEVTLWQEWEGTVGPPTNSTAMSVGGWMLTDHHRYDSTGRTLYRGDGGQRSAENVGGTITTVAGTGRQGFSGDGGPATKAQLNAARSVAVDPDGSFYIADYFNERIRRVDPDGIITTVAGSGERGFGGDGGPATEAQLNGPEGVAVGSDGNFYIADTGNRRIRRVGPDGVITTVAGTGERGFGGDGGPATEALFDRPTEVAIGSDDSVYIADIRDNRIRRVGPDGIVTTAAGTGELCWFLHPDYPECGDGGPATNASFRLPSSVAVGPDGSVSISDQRNHRVRRIGLDGVMTAVARTGGTPVGVAVDSDGGVFVAEHSNQRVRRVGADGTITTVAGSGEQGFGGDGGPATRARLNAPTDVAVGPDDDVYIVDRANARIRRVQRPTNGYDGTEQVIASEDGTELYIFDAVGRHLETVHAVTGKMLREFEYDDGLLVSVTDADGNTLEITHDDDGAPTAIIAPFGHKTDLAVDDDGYLSSVTDPAGQQWQLSHTDDGLLVSRTHPRGHTSEYNYDDDGLLVEARDPNGAAQTLARTETENGREVVHTSAEGRETRYIQERTDDSGRRAVTVMPNGARKVILSHDGVQEATYPDGSTATLRQTGDPRFGMQAPMVDELTVSTPAGRTTTVDVEREVTLADPDDPLSVEQVADTVWINDEVSERVYDADSGEVTVTSAAGREWTAELDELGRPLRIDGGAALATERFNYDERGLLSELGHGSRSWIYTHDAFGRVERVETAESQTFTHTYDDADRLVSTTVPSGARYGFEFDATELPTRIVMPSGAAHELEYAHFGRVASYTPPEATAGLERSFDADRWLHRRTLPSGRTVDVSYDEDLPAGEEYAEATVEFGYAADGEASDQQQRATWTPTGDGPIQEITFEYDGTLVTETGWTGAANGTFSYDYDDNFFLTRLTLSSGDDAFEVELSRDEDGGLTGFGPFTFDRDGPNREVSAVSDGTSFVDLNYNAHAELSNRSQRVDGELVYDLELTHDDAGRIVRRKETVVGDTTMYDYTYDEDSRLTEVRHDETVVEAYDYDDNANRVSRQSKGGPVETATYDSQDRLIEFGDTDYEFDEDGFLVRRNDDTFSYSARGELLEATVGDRTVTYTYDAFGRRVARTDGDGTTEYLYGNPGDPFQVTAIRDSDDVLTVYYYDPDGLLFGLEREGDRYYVATDQVGTPRAVTDDSGEVVRAVDYDSFGNRTADTDPGFELGIGFAGGLTDPVTGLVRFGMRDYDPDAGRWTARDPILFGGEQANLYVYVSNSPVTQRDPSGLQGVTDRESSSARGVKVGGSFFVGFGGGAELVVGPDGISVCVEVGVGKGASIDVDPYAKYATAGTRTKVSAGVGFGPASVGVGVTFDPCSPRPGFKTTGGFGPVTLGGSADGFEFSTGGKPGDLSKNIRDTVSMSNMRFGAKGTVTVEGCWAW